ncbi:MAG: hypothetical protein QXI32_00855 [Candidatus Bathyarchaeia archaeon]
MKTLKISDEVHRELSKLVGELRAENGGAKTFEDAIRYLLKIREEARKVGRVEKA